MEFPGRSGLRPETEGADMQTYAAHIHRESGRTQTLAQHAENVAALCARNAAPLHLESAARLIALLHDMGKATQAFQDYLREEGQSSPHHHAPAGAIYAYERWFSMNDPKARQRAAQTIALCIYGHHTGLMDCVNPRSEPQFLSQMRQEKRLLHYEEAAAYFTENVVSEGELDALFDAACDELTRFRDAANSGAFYDGLTARLLLSMLVDADRYDAACFEYGEDALTAPPAPVWDELLARLNRYTAAHFTADTPIGQIRAQIANRCAEAVSRAPGVYRLTVPTGGGKTLSSLRFALGHAALLGMERIFYVIPFNTILDQNARDIRDALDGYGGILEHHANVVVEGEDECAQYRRLTERWDSRIILTSMVQFLNALYRCENSNARRMHSLTRSVIIFDEIQALPRKCKVLFERAVNFLSQRCGCTVLLCSATQMELGGIALSDDCELMGDSLALSRLYDALTRVRWMPELNPTLDNEHAAKKLCGLLLSLGGVLAVVNTKAVAWDVYSKAVDWLKERGMGIVTPDVIADEEAAQQRAHESSGGKVLCVHLSTQLCPAHRLKYIDIMKAWLRGGGRALCVSTALIEAGINISFPAVVRSLAGIPSIVQAGGRCNRNMERETGEVFIWDFREERLDKLPEIQNGKDISRTLYNKYRGGCDTLCKPEGIREYFLREQKFTTACEKYDFKDGKKGRNLVDLLSMNKAYADEKERRFLMKQAFRTAGEIFRVIVNNTYTIIVPYGEGADIIAALLSVSDMKHRALLLTRAQQYSVNVYDNIMRQLMNADAVYPIGDTGALALKPEYYDAERGLHVKGRVMEEMIF